MTGALLHLNSPFRPLAQTKKALGLRYPGKFTFEKLAAGANYAVTTLIACETRHGSESLSRTRGRDGRAQC